MERINKHIQQREIFDIAELRREQEERKTLFETGSDDA
jgi:hypothetical protein